MSMLCESLIDKGGGLVLTNIVVDLRKVETTTSKNTLIDSC
jgi:hypothetical protein